MHKKTGMIKAKQLYIWFVLLYPFVLANSRMLDSIPGYYFFSIALFYPKNIALIVWIIVVLVFYFFFGLKGTKYAPTYVLALIFSIVTIGSLFSDIGLVYIFQGVVVFLFPFFIYNTIRGFDDIPVTFENALNKIVLYGFINIPFAVYAFLFFRDLGSEFNPFDSINGLFSDSHQFAMYNFFVSLLFWGLWVGKKKNRYIFFSFIFAGVGYFGFNEKAFILFVLIFLPVVFLSIKKYRIGIILFSFILVYFSDLGNMENQEKFGLRLDLLRKTNISEIPIIKTYLEIPEILTSNPQYIVFGSGWGGFGTPIAFSRIANGLLTNVAQKYNYFSLYSSLNIEGSEYIQQSALDWSSTLFVGCVIEFGLFGTLLFFNLYRKLFLLFKCITSSKKSYSYFGYAMKYYLILVLLLSLVTTYTSFEEVVVIIPMFVLTALTAEDKSYRKEPSAVQNILVE